MSNVGSGTEDVIHDIEPPVDWQARCLDSEKRLMDENARLRERLIDCVELCNSFYYSAACEEDAKVFRLVASSAMDATEVTP